jgi:UDP-N-acetylglucosamine 4,6-dehydratase/5-epimerase
MINYLKNLDKFNDKIILITGGTGTFGHNLIRILHANCKPKKVIIFSRDEFKQYNMQKIFVADEYSYLRFFIGDVRDYKRLKFAFVNVNYIFHAAALKHVNIIEYNPNEAVKTNIYGTENVIMAAIENNVSEVIALSTDKCVEPCNLYGATKLCLEKLIIGGNILSGGKTKFSVLRYGNVFGSRGSVLPLFLNQKKNNILTITDDNMTRFTLTIEQAINFVLNCAVDMIGGEVFVPKLPSYNVMQLAKLIAPEAKINIIGIRPGEKLHESMLSKHETYNTLVCDDKYIILPSTIDDDNGRNIYSVKYGNNYCKPGFSYSSDKNKLVDNSILLEMINNYKTNINL